MRTATNRPLIIIIEIPARERQAVLRTPQRTQPRRLPVPRRRRGGERAEDDFILAVVHRRRQSNQPLPRPLLDRRQPRATIGLSQRALREAPRHAGQASELTHAEEAADNGKRLVGELVHAERQQPEQAAVDGEHLVRELVAHRDHLGPQRGQLGRSLHYVLREHHL